LGQVCGYALGREVGPWLRASRVGRLLGEHRWTRAEEYLAGHGARILVPVRFVSVVHSIAPVVAGTVRMPFRRFALWAALGAVIWASVYTSLGAAAGAAYREYGHLGLITSVLLLGAAAGAMALRSRRARQSRDRDPAEAQRPADQGQRSRRLTEQQPRHEHRQRRHEVRGGAQAPGAGVRERVRPGRERDRGGE
ncbi:MAG: DedA family protein, partial [Dactylosporangium sp.]|nr:DedA family protein [Dactylosporangium sp.]